MCNRLLQRMIFTARYYNFAQALQAVLRMPFGNIVNITAFFRAFFQVRQSKKSGRAYPLIGEKTIPKPVSC